MSKIPVINIEGKAVETVELDPAVFDGVVNDSLMHQAIVMYLANQRKGLACSKTKGEVSGGGKKPWRQKGTGRARAGSTRSPLWRSGAIVHGPQARSYGFKINKRIRQLALKMALSSRLATDNLLVVDKLNFDEIKTKKFVSCRDTLGLKKALIVVGKQDTNLFLSARNVPGIEVLDHSSINVYEILKYPQTVLDREAVAALHERLK